MERQEVLSLIRLELRKFAKPGEETSGFTADRIIMSDAGGVLQPHSSISGTDLSRLEGFLDSAVVTHSSVATSADTSTSLATAGAVKQAISNLVAAAPGHLDTLDELAAALGDDNSFATTITNALSGKAPVFTAGNHLSFSGIGTLQLNVNAPDDTAGGTNGDTGLITSNAVFDGLATKQDTITGAATTIDREDLTASRALISNGSGKIAVSDVTSTELGYLDGLVGRQGTGTRMMTIADGTATARVLAIGSGGNVYANAITETELGMLDGVSSNIQAQLDALQPQWLRIVSHNNPCASNTWDTVSFGHAETERSASMTAMTHSTSSNADKVYTFTTPACIV